MHTHAEVASVWPADRQLLTHAVLWRCVRVRSVDRQCAGLWQRVSAWCQGDVFSVTLCWPDLRSDCPLRPHCGSLHNPCCHSHTGLKGSTRLHTHTQSYMVTCTWCIGIHIHILSHLGASERQIRCCPTLPPLSYLTYASIKWRLHKLTPDRGIWKQSVELWAVCGNIVWSQRVSWFPQCAQRHLHNLCNSYQEFDTALNSDICTMLIDVSVLACGHLCWWWCAFKSAVHARTEWVTLCAVLWPVVIWRSAMMWSLPAGVDLLSSALLRPAST